VSSSDERPQVRRPDADRGDPTERGSRDADFLRRCADQAAAGRTCPATFDGRHCDHGRPCCYCNLEAPSAAEPITGELLPPAAAGESVPGRRAKTSGARHLDLVRRVDEKIRVEASRILLDAFAARHVDEGAPKPEGWSDSRYRTAQRAIKCGREAPAYIAHAARMVESYRRSEALEDRKPSPTLNCEIVVHVGSPAQKYEYPVIKVRDE
jgi:hypothetical protein